MQITVELPDDIARHADPGREALESLAIEGARSGKLTTEQVRRLLGFQTRYETDGFLKQHQVYYDLTCEEVERDAAVAWDFSQCSSSPTPPRSTTSS